MERLLDEDEVDSAMHDPPTDTRAYFRGRCLEKYAEDVAAASWDSVIFDLPGRESLQRVPTIDPLRGSKAHVGHLLDHCDTAEPLFSALTPLNLLYLGPSARQMSSRARGRRWCGRRRRSAGRRCPRGP